MNYQQDREVNQAIIQLLDALCQYERDSGRRSTLILIPHEPDEKLVAAQDGKPLPEMNAAKTDQVYYLAMMERKQKTIGFKGGK